ncbi:MAG: transaldolase [Candidatus Symbiobacter sp.]|nr:transaldolase [Candidatus Symbiobacter sp.]
MSLSPTTDPMLLQIQAAGQSIWSDALSRDEIRSGRLAALIAAGVTGVTSNPVIFEQAISKSNDYDADIAAIVKKAPNLTPKQIYESLAVQDIQEAADLLEPVYKATQGRDGFVSLEVDPHLAYDSQATVEEARRLFKWINRGNVMIKIPASSEGIFALRQLAEPKNNDKFININMTLIFSLEQYQAIFDAWTSGIGKYRFEYSVFLPQCVASFFMSRIDVLLEKHLAELVAANRLLPFEAEYLTPPLMPSMALAAAEQAYEIWKSNQEKGNTPRLLWASTGVKNPAWPDTYYLENLIAANTINTVPPAALAAMRDHGRIKPTQLNFAHLANNKCLQDLARPGMTLERLGARLLPDGIKIFTDAQDRLLAAIQAKAASLKP